MYICDFHREQSWVHWMKTPKHGVSAVKDEVHMFNIAISLIYRHLFIVVAILCDTAKPTVAVQNVVIQTGAL